jgi:hypothetical protein
MINFGSSSRFFKLDGSNGMDDMLKFQLVRILEKPLSTTHLIM